MGDLAIRVNGLGKQYRIGAGRPGYRTFREALSDGLAAPVKRLRGLSANGEDRTIWALRDVSFEVKHGEVLGIIGRNGAGKSTLLKILSRITEPTRGCAEIRGRVGSLLEVGTGFHPELTGRENIYLNGAILGMRRADIQRKFDEIVAFAEVEKFIDTPVKHYSSGMYLRLAFAVAAHLEPDILLVDEVLAVGDAAFQKKCLGKMDDVAKEGRTVLFVSHNMPAIQNLCLKTILLERGKLRSVGATNKVVTEYLEMIDDGLTSYQAPTCSAGSPIRSVRLKSQDGRITTEFAMGAPLIVEIAVANLQDRFNIIAGVSVHTAGGTKVFGFHSAMKGYVMDIPDGSGVFRCSIDRLPLTAGFYSLTVSLTRGMMEYIQRVENAVKFRVVGSDIYATGFLVSNEYGVVYVDGDWSLDKDE